VTIKVNVDQIGNGKSGAAPVLAFYMDQGAADDILPDDIKVVGVSSGAALVDANAVDQGAAGFAAASLKIFDDATGADNTTVLISGSAQVLRKTQPTVATVASSTTLINGQNTIYKFSVTAASNADVALRRISMNSSPTGIVADTVQVYENGTLLNTALYTVQNAGGNNLKTVSNGGANRSIGEVGNSVIVEFATERVVSAGTTKTYDIKANVTGAAATDSISTYIMSDVVTDLIATSVITTGGGTNGVEGNASANFIWSDTSADGHTATAAGTVASGCTADWTTGFLVKTLPTTPQSLSL